jgi:hypothetical protein
MGSFNSEARHCVCCVLNSEACVLEDNCLLKNVWKIILYSVCTGTGLRRSVDWDNVDSIVTCHGLGFGLQREQDFLQVSKLALGPPISCTVGTRSHSLGVKCLGRGIDHSLPSSTDVKGRVDLYYSCGPSWPVVG